MLEGGTYNVNALSVKLRVSAQMTKILSNVNSLVKHTAEPDSVVPPVFVLDRNMF